MIIIDILVSLFNKNMTEKLEVEMVSKDADYVIQASNFCYGTH